MLTINTEAQIHRRRFFWEKNLEKENFECFLFEPFWSSAFIYELNLPNGLVITKKIRDDLVQAFMS